jgi:uncharacterized BrkB/YihY/UPF0761 family membrane protein
MRLITAHKILIGAALVLALLLIARSAFSYASSRAGGDLAFTAAGVVLALALAVYLRALWHK